MKANAELDVSDNANVDFSGGVFTADGVVALVHGDSSVKLSSNGKLLLENGAIVSFDSELRVE